MYFYIKFRTAPDEDDIALISQLSPEPIKVHPENFAGRTMYVVSSPYVNQEIENLYGVGKIPKGVRPEFYSSEEARRHFEQHIEQ